MTMKKLLLLLIAILPLWLCGRQASAQGLPFMRNYYADEYGAHRRSFDILVDAEKGMVYVANFEGLLTFDNARWNIIHTPGINRLTKLHRGGDGRIWVGGYNYIGYLENLSDGHVTMRQAGDSFRGEVEFIWESAGRTRFSTVSGDVYEIDDETFAIKKEDAASEDFDVVIPAKKVFLADDFWAVPTSGGGVRLTDNFGDIIFELNEDNGLCNNNVNSLSYDGRGLLWGATDNGIFTLAVPAAYSRFSASEGLKGEVLSIVLLGEEMFVGTLSGLFLKKGTSFKPVGGINHACWSLDRQGASLLAATASGVYKVDASGGAKQLTSESAMSVMADGDGFYSGEIDGFYHTSPSGARSKLSDIEKVTSILTDRHGSLWIRNLYGDVAVRRQAGGNFEIVGDEQEVSTLVKYNDDVLVIDANKEGTLFPYPQFSLTDRDGTLWLTDGEGKHLYAYRDGQRQSQYDQKLYPLGNIAVRALLRHNNLLWIGTSEGLLVVDMLRSDLLLSAPNSLCIRSASFNSERFASFTYSLVFEALYGSTLYRYRLNEGSWSEWSSVHETSLPGLSPGGYSFQIQAIDAKGQVYTGEIYEFNIPMPFYLRWYMVILYALALLALGSLGARWRTRQLEKDKERLEGVVRERTANLEKALQDLGKAQDQLVRQEKMATAGKLTQGLIDRILNPMNYINNFSKLSAGLIDDLKANISGEKEKIDEDVYEDTMDVLDMLGQNLEKVENHGMNTSRILKAMEEILRERSGSMTTLNVSDILRLDSDMVGKYYEADVSRLGIKVVFDCPIDNIPVRGNSEQLSKCFMSMIGNSVYALVRKASLGVSFEPELRITAGIKDGKAVIRIYDNGTGIEEAILDKIFDPFFTTKTTNEAAGVGLYLTQDIIQSHGGSIRVSSEKQVYTEFVIELPLS